MRFGCCSLIFYVIIYSHHSGLTTINGSSISIVDDADSLSLHQSRTNTGESKAKDFSGLYRPPLVGSEFYAGSWLAPKKRLLHSLENVKKISNLEGASFHVVLTGPGTRHNDTFNQYNHVCMYRLYLYDIITSVCHSIRYFQ